MSVENRIDIVAKKIATVQAHFEEELKKEKRGRMIFAIVAAVLALFMLFAVLRIRGFITEYVTPKSVAQLIKAEASRFLTPENLEKSMAELLPSLRTEVSATLKARAPAIVEGLNVQVVEEILPAIRKMAEDQVVQFGDGAIQAAAREMEDTATQVIRAANVRISDPAEAAMLGDPEAVAAMLKGLVQLELNKRLTETPEEPLAAQLAASREQLRSINRKLKALATKKDLTRTEVLAKRLIQAWMSVVDQNLEASPE